MENHDGNELLQRLVSGIKACPLDRLPDGNSTTHPFSLSVHGSAMMQRGIEEYVRDTRRKFESGSEDAYCCLLRTETAITEARKLRGWFVELKPDYLAASICMMDLLLRELAFEKKRFETQG